MIFHSILYENRKSEAQGISEPKDIIFFKDLSIDQIINAILSDKEEYDLEPFYLAYQNEPETIFYRQEIMNDLENEKLLNTLNSFAGEMKKMRESLAALEKLYYKNQIERQFLDIVSSYCKSVLTLYNYLSSKSLESRGLLGFIKYLKDYIDSNNFKSITENASQIIEDLSSVKYNILIKGLQVQVRKYNSEINYSEEVEETFLRFKQGEVKDHKAKIERYPNLNQVEAKIVDGVSELFPDIFARMHLFYKINLDFADPTIVAFDREIQFYISYLNYIAPIKKTGMKFCLPQISILNKEISSKESFDLALASKLVSEGQETITNDFFLKGKERMIVVSGPNQGGKTTFARSFGQMHYLAGLGCPVPGREARLFHCDQILTHFEKEENIANLRGKLHDELFRIHHILEKATTNSLVIINEIFTSTTLHDQIFLSEKIMEKLSKLDMPGVWVTFIDELASYNEKSVSMISTVVPETPSDRTFKIIRNPANGLAYALSIAEKYKLTYRDILERLKL